MATRSDTDAVGQADYECSSDSDTSDSGQDVPTSPRFQAHVTWPGVTTKSHDKALPVFDLRHNKFARPSFKNFTLTSISKDAVQKKVSEDFKARPDQVLVLESKGRVEETPLQTWIIVLPQYDIPAYQLLLIEVIESLDQTHAGLLCSRLDKTLTVKAAMEMIRQELGWKAAGICRDRQVLRPDLTIANLDRDFPIVQIIKSQVRNGTLVYKPKPNVSYSYNLEVDITVSVSTMKAMFLRVFQDDMLTCKINGDKVLHISYHEMSLKDGTCIGMVLRGSKDDTFQIHIAEPDAICVTLKYKIARGKTRVPYFQQTSIRADCSTSHLRTEAAKYLNVDPKAVKLTIADKRIEEHTKLKGLLKKGTQISVGIKKKKTVQICNQETNQECSVDIYMLETVHVLKTAVARHFGVDPLQVSLQCRGTDMQDNDLLQNYPIKNKMELTMELFRNRIVTNAVIIFIKKRVRLVIDNTHTSTIEDVLMYCACKFGYSRQHSRAIFEQRCLNKYDTLQEAGVHSGSTVHIVYFDHYEAQQGNLIRIYTVRPDGQINPRWGSVCEGVLLHACKKLDFRQEPDKESPNNGCTLPPGIHMEADCQHLHGQPARQGVAHNPGNVGIEGTDIGDTARIRKINKEKFMEKARVKRQRSLDMEQTLRKQMYLERGDDSSPPSLGSFPTSTEESGQSEDETNKSAALGKFDVSGSSKKTLKRKTSQVQFYLSESPQENLTELSLVNTSTPVQSQSRDRSVSRDCEATRIYTGDEKEELSQINLDKDQPVSQMKARSQSIQSDAKSFVETETGGCSTFNENVNELHCLETYQGVVSSSADDSTSDMNDSSSSHDKSTYTSFDQNLQRFNQMRPYHIQCPFLQQHPLQRPIVNYYKSPGLHHTLSHRRRCRTEGEEAVEDLTMLQPISTWPCIPKDMQPNADLNTSGITVEMLNYVSLKVGRHWKQLARQLKLDESILDNIEEQQKGLQETSFQTLKAWKTSRGVQGTKTELLDALKNIGMQSIVDICDENFGYMTA